MVNVKRNGVIFFKQPICVLFLSPSIHVLFHGNYNKYVTPERDEIQTKCCHSNINTYPYVPALNQE